MSWKSFVHRSVAELARVSIAELEHGDLSLIDDLGLGSLQLTQLMRMLDEQAKRALPTEDWFARELAGGEASLGSLIAWLDAHAPISG
jgi:acyl carrier protein